LIPKLTVIKATRDLALFTRLVNQYKKPLLASKLKVENLTDEIELLKKKGGFISSLKINMPISGIQVQLNKEKAWYEVYSELYPIWKKNAQHAKEILDQVNREHGQWNTKK
jgi:hypothetical protein